MPCASIPPALRPRRTGIAPPARRGDAPPRHGCAASPTRAGASFLRPDQCADLRAKCCGLAYARGRLLPPWRAERAGPACMRAAHGRMDSGRLGVATNPVQGARPVLSRVRAAGAGPVAAARPRRFSRLASPCPRGPRARAGGPRSGPPHPPSAAARSTRTPATARGAGGERARSHPARPPSFALRVVGRGRDAYCCMRAGREPAALIAAGCDGGAADATGRSPSPKRTGNGCRCRPRRGRDCRPADRPPR